MSTISTPPRAVQRDFDFRFPARSVLVPVEVLKAHMDLREDQIENMARDGKLGWCFDISAKAIRRRELRTSCFGLTLYLNHCQPVLDESALETILANAVPHQFHPDIFAVEFCRLWQCSTTHVAKLIEEKLLEDCSREGRKLTHSRRITRASALDFLRSRKIPS